MEKIKKVLTEPLIYILMLCILFNTLMYKTIKQYMVYNDTSTYNEEYTENIFKGEVNAKRTPVYPYFIKLIKTIGGKTNLYIHITEVQKVLFWISIILFYFTLKKLTKNKLIISLLTLSYGICPFTVFWNTTILTEGITLIETVFLLYLTISYLKEKKIYQSILMGLAVFIMIMTRPSNIYLLALYFVFWIVRFFLYKEERKQNITGLVSIVFVILMILSYCCLMKIQHGQFGITKISYINNFVIAVDSGDYQYADNHEMVQKIEDIKAGRKDGSVCWEVLGKIEQEYSKDEISEFASNAIRNSKIKHLKYLTKKTIDLSNLPITTNYTENKAKYKNINYLSIANLIMPINFGMLYILLIGTFVYLLYYLLKYRKIEWTLAILSLIIAGNIFVTIVAAPFESQRLCLLSVPIVLMLVAYIINIVYYKNKIKD